jgi:hypothetical protein
MWKAEVRLAPIRAGTASGGGLSASSRWKGFKLAVFYVLGLALVYASLGAFAALSGRMFGAMTTSPWTYLVVAELVAANSGLGYSILKAQRFLQTDKIFVGIILIGLIGLVMDQLFRLAHRKAFPWLYLR